MSGKPMPEFQRWSMAKGSDGKRWSVYMDHDPSGEWVKWVEVQQHFFALALTAAQQQGQAVAWADEWELAAAKRLLQRGLTDGTLSAQVRGPAPGYVPLYTAPPPSAPVGMEGLADRIAEKVGSPAVFPGEDEDGGSVALWDLIAHARGEDDIGGAREWLADAIDVAIDELMIAQQPAAAPVGVEDHGVASPGEDPKPPHTPALRWLADREAVATQEWQDGFNAAYSYYAQQPAPPSAPVVATITNPWTGEPRDYRDVNSDPGGVLCVEPGAPLEAASDPEGLTVKQAWWAGYRTGKSQPPETPRDAALAQQPAAVDGVLAAVRGEVVRATAKFPTWPTDPLHASGVLQEEAGELAKAVLQAVYEPHKSTPEDVATEALQTAAMAVRFLVSMGRYDWAPGVQHRQE